MNFKILDCTLRDGGYVNDWFFDIDTARGMMDGLYNSGVRWIEIGIMGKNPQIGLQTKFENFEQIEPLLINRRDDCTYAVMVTTNSSDDFVFPHRSSSTPDLIRIAFFKPEISNTFELAKKILNLGYMVFLQPMATFMYEDSELDCLVKMTNGLHPHGLYMVDSFSTMYPKDVIDMEKQILSLLDKDILFGFHAHNNIQMAYSNVQTFISNSENRSILVDSSIYGMGRGAGNVPTELLMSFSNSFCDNKYNVGVVLDLFDRYLNKIYRNTPWGYSLPYFLTSVKKVNSVWGWFFMKNGISEISDLMRAIEMIPNDLHYTLNPTVGKQIVDTIMS